MKKFNALCIFILIALVSCKKDDETPVVTDYRHGIFIVNEGSFGNNNGSLTHISTEGTITQDVYFNQNQVELGDVLQSFTVIGSKGYAVLNNSQRIEVIELSNMKNAATISGLTYPRSIANGGNGKAYVTDGSMAGLVHVVDLGTNVITQSIAVGNGPENLALSGNNLFVCNSGGWSLDNTVSVIDITTNSIVQTISVGDRPTDLTIDSNGDCWILCSGETIYDADWNITGHTDAMIYRIDGTTFAVEDAQTIGVSGDHPRLMDIAPDGETIYFENNGVFALAIDATDFDGIQIISDSRNSLNIHPVSGDIWCAGSTNFVDASNVYQYQSTGELRNTYTAGIGSNGCAFN